MGDLAGMFGRARNFDLSWNLMLVDVWNSSVELCPNKYLKIWIQHISKKIFLQLMLEILLDPFFCKYVFGFQQVEKKMTFPRLEDFTPPSIEAFWPLLVRMIGSWLHQPTNRPKEIYGLVISVISLQKEVIIKSKDFFGAVNWYNLLIWPIMICW